MWCIRPHRGATVLRRVREMFVGVWPNCFSLAGPRTPCLRRGWLYRSGDAACSAPFDAETTWVPRTRPGEGGGTSRTIAEGQRDEASPYMFYDLSTGHHALETTRSIRIDT